MDCHDFWVCKGVDKARLFFDEAPVRDRGIWGAMISGYAKQLFQGRPLYVPVDAV